MIFKSLSIYLALFLALATASADTVTQTNYIYPTNFLAVVDYILKDNPANVNSGIPIVFVYEDPSTRTPTAQIQPAVQTYGATDASAVQPQSQAPQSTFVTSSAFAYTTSLQSTSYNTFTTCTGNKCGITTQSTVVPHYYTTNTMVTYTTTGTNTPQLPTLVAPLSQTTPSTKTTTPETTKLVSPSFSSVATSPALTSPPSTAVTSSGSTTAATSKKARSTIYDTEYVTQSSNINYIITATALTTTKVIFLDTTVPTTVFKPLTTVETISQTIRNPLGSNLAVSSLLTQSLTTDFSKDVTITSDPTSLKSSSATGSSSVGSGSSTSKSVSSGAKGFTSDSTDKTVSSGKTVATGTSSTATGTAKTALSSASAITSLAGSETSGTTTASSGKTTPQGPFVSGNSSSSSATQSFTSTIDLRVTSGSPALSSLSVKYYNVSSPHSSTITSSGSISILSISTSSLASSGSSSSAVTSTSTESGSILSSGTSSSISATESSSSISSRSTSSSSGSSSISSSSASTSISSSSATTSASSETSSSISSSLSASSKSSSKASSSSTSSSSSATPSTTGAIEISAATDGVVLDLFSVIDTASPPLVFTREELPLSIPTGVDTSLPFGTNKFYANLFLGDQTDTIWPAPYGMFWKTTDYYGFGVTHTNASQRVYGSADTNNVGVDSYYLNPTGNAELIFSATLFASGEVSVLSVSDQQELSVLVTLSASSSDTTNVITMPVVNGMGFVTAIYSGSLVPELNSLIGVQTLTLETSTLLASNVLKYRATLYNGVEWLIYVTIPSDITTTFSLTASDGFHIVGTGAVNGLIIQVAYTDNTGESFYDESAGTYVTGATVTGSSSGDAAEYGFEYTSVGSSTPIVFAYPHQQDALSLATSATYTGLEVLSTTKGVMKGYYTKSLIMEETLIPAGFLPWTSIMTGSLTYTAEQLLLIASVANTELAVDIAATVQGADSNYFSGKIIDKYAYILLVVSDILQDEDVTKTTLASMKLAFTQFTENTQYYPLIYDTKFKGVTSSASQGGDTGADYGSGYYNDHHFHYGYFVHAAAIVGYVDNKLGGTWVEENKDWVNSLIRDVANPSTDDSYFPTSRMFDWFGGHSWAAGLFASGDGKNQESSSEDFNFSYGMRLWGSVIGDSAMQARGDLMLAVTSRAMNKYMYYKSDNTVEPEEILANKVSGIFFENKVAYTTYFGSPDTHPEYVHGIHMLPITPASSIVRIPSYVEEEWTDQVSTFIDDVDSGWTGILRLNQALYDADSSYSFFSLSSWSDTYLDDGQSRTWSLAFSGGVSNS